MVWTSSKDVAIADSCKVGSSLNFLGDISTSMLLDVTTSSDKSNFPGFTLQLIRATASPSTHEVSKWDLNFGSKYIILAYLFSITNCSIEVLHCQVALATVYWR